MSSSILTSAEAAAILRRSDRTVARLALSGELPYIRKLGGKQGGYLFDRHVVEMFARSRRDRRFKQNRIPA